MNLCSYKSNFLIPLRNIVILPILRIELVWKNNFVNVSIIIVVFCDRDHYVKYKNYCDLFLAFSVDITPALTLLFLKIFIISSGFIFEIKIFYKKSLGKKKECLIYSFSQFYTIILLYILTQNIRTVSMWQKTFAYFIFSMVTSKKFLISSRHL